MKLVNSNRRRRRYERENDVGIWMIKDRLARADRRITSVKAGQKLADYLLKEDEEKVRKKIVFDFIFKVFLIKFHFIREADG